MTWSLVVMFQEFVGQGTLVSLRIMLTGKMWQWLGLQAAVSRARLALKIRRQKSTKPLLQSHLKSQTRPQSFSTWTLCWHSPFAGNCIVCRHLYSASHGISQTETLWSYAAANTWSALRASG